MSDHNLPKLKIGMSFDEVCTVLGQPIGTNPGSDILGGKGQVVGVSTKGGLADTRSRLFFTKYASWRRPEGHYDLIFEHERLARISTAPEGVCVESADTDDNALPARFVWVVTNGGSDTPQEVFETMRREGELSVTSDAIVIGDALPDVAVDLPTDSVMTRAVVCALKALQSAEKGEDFLDMDSLRVRRFRRARGAGSAGVIVIISGPTHDPDSRFLAAVPRKKQRDVCAKCGVTLERRVAWWLESAPSGFVKVGGRDLTGLFLYCENCQEAICGGCSVDLGMSAGCPFCRKEATEMTHQEIEALLRDKRR